MVPKLASEITRVAAGDDRVRYDGLEMIFHWLTAILVVSLFGLAEAWDLVARPTRHVMENLHVSLGLTLIVVLVCRILWRAGPGRRVLPATTGFVEVASQMVHYVLYALLACEVVLGVLFRWAAQDPLSFFGLFTFPALLEFSRAQRHQIAETHNYVAITIISLAGLHAAAALFHHFWLRDDVLWRMMPGLQARRAERQAPDPRAIEGDAA